MAGDKKIIIFVDRDGTIIYDDKYYLGSQKDWKKKAKFLPHVISGLKLLMKIANSRIYMITNQSGIAIKEFPLLTNKKAREVSDYVVNKINKRGIVLNGSNVCGHVSPSYVKNHKEFTFNKKLVGDFSCIKPKPGMIKEILRRENISRRNSEIYVIGDRALDVKTALNVKGSGIIVPFENEKGEKEKVNGLKNKNTYIAKDFLDAAKFIVKKNNQ